MLREQQALLKQLIEQQKKVSLDFEFITSFSTGGVGQVHILQCSKSMKWCLKNISSL